MPFTPSHAVVALPFIRTPLVPAAIAVGAMTPDLPLFVRTPVLRYATTHDPLWLPVTVAIALGLLLVWRVILRPAAAELSPAWLADRLPPEWTDRRRGWRETFPSLGGVMLLVLSLAIGVLSHIVWDAFTHEDRWGSALLPVLAADWGPLTGYKWLQHASSAAGLVVLAAWGLGRLRRASPTAAPRRLPHAARVGWWLSLPILLALAAVVGYVVAGPFRPGFGVAHLAYLALPPACALWGLGTLLLASFVRLRLPPRHR